MAFIRAGIRLGFGAAFGGNGWGFLVSCLSLCVNLLGGCCKRLRDSVVLMTELGWICHNWDDRQLLWECWWISRNHLLLILTM